MPNNWAIALIPFISPASTPTIFLAQNMIQLQVGGNITQYSISLYMNIYIYACAYRQTHKVCTAEEQPQSGLGATGDLPISSIYKLAPGFLGK